MIKRIFGVAVASIMALSLFAACGPEGGNDDPPVDPDPLAVPLRKHSPLPHIEELIFEGGTSRVDNKYFHIFSVGGSALVKNKNFSAYFLFDFIILFTPCLYMFTKSAKKHFNAQKRADTA